MERLRDFWRGCVNLNTPGSHQSSLSMRTNWLTDKAMIDWSPTVLHLDINLCKYTNLKDRAGQSARQWSDFGLIRICSTKMKMHVDCVYDCLWKVGARIQWQYGQGKGRQLLGGRLIDGRPKSKEAGLPFNRLHILPAQYCNSLGS